MAVTRSQEMTLDEALDWMRTARAKLHEDFALVLPLDAPERKAALEIVDRMERVEKEIALFRYSVQTRPEISVLD